MVWIRIWSLTWFWSPCVCQFQVFIFHQQFACHLKGYDFCMVWYMYGSSRSIASHMYRSTVTAIWVILELLLSWPWAGKAAPYHTWRWPDSNSTLFGITFWVMYRDWYFVGFVAICLYKVYYIFETIEVLFVTVENDDWKSYVYCWMKRYLNCGQNP